MTPYEVAFHETLLALGQDNLNNLTVVGGWCPYLYAKYVWQKQAPEIMTMDIDFAVKHMTPDRFSEPVYHKLLAANLVPRRMDIDDDNKIQFSYMVDRVLIPVDFISEPDVLPEGQHAVDRPYVACYPVPEVAIALKPEPIHHTINFKGKDLKIQIAAPEGLLLSKALLLEHRVNTTKTPKDLATIAFIMRYAPDREILLQNIEKLKGHAEVREAGRILEGFVGNDRRPGYGMLRDYYSRWNVPKELIDDQIKRTFVPLLSALSLQGQKTKDQSKEVLDHGADLKKKAKDLFRPVNQQEELRVQVEEVRSRLKERTDLNPEVRQQVIQVLESRMGKKVCESKSLTPDGRIAAARVIVGEATLDQVTKDLPEIQHGVVRALARAHARGHESGQGFSR